MENTWRTYNQHEKTVATAMVLSMLLSFGACSAKDAFAEISLTETQRAWSDPDAKYKAVLDEYADDSCTGTYVVATDKDIVYLYAEKAFEKDGKTGPKKNYQTFHRVQTDPNGESWESKMDFVVD